MGPDVGTSHLLAFRARLAPGVASLPVEDATAVLVAVVDRFPWRVETDDRARPSLGSGFEPDARLDDVCGVAVVAGHALVGVACDNLGWPDADGDEGIGVDGPTRLEGLLSRLGRMTTGPAGEVVGAHAQEGGDGFGETGWPIVRCRDGRLRVLHPGWDGEGAGSGGPDTPMPAAVPIDLVEVEDATTARVGVRALRARLAPLEGVALAVTPEGPGS